ncbi:biotin-dependent carboxyltransferase family protein [Paenibacillus sp. FSL R5-0527]|uniref:5-oxoprolinase subunit C family protein n=1 Tax=Paenibacillus TaxID=44249 RepID=UPI000979FD83|nr:biotin-dependent carboxyltransferase family protein [Paenibacillus macerans]MBS5910495.1 biotin-dependent carboxyltransferase [Paenibacillus macerans]OMG51149.1 KipI antagonist [Paenibacillus macerans]GIP10698.1 KipI antagonist [Paenibacillus macerans]
MSLLITKPGLLTTVQDLGRFGAQKYGVIVSGAMDAFALRIANLLVGNEEGAAGLEITMTGPEIRFEQTALISICGGDLSPKLNGVSFPGWRTVLAPKGSALTFGPMKQGCRTYLAVGGGLEVPLLMNSRSTYLRAGIGGYGGRALAKGDRLPVGNMCMRSLNLLALLARKAENSSGAISRWSVSADLIPPYEPNPKVQVIAGEQYDWFEEESKALFAGEPFEVLPQSDRMGYRLKGPRLKLTKSVEMLSSAVTMGTVQVPPDGNPIVLMADRQTTGGYPKIAQAASVDLPLLAQVNLGGKVRFKRISLGEAQRQFIEREKAVLALRQGLDHLQQQK